MAYWKEHGEGSTGLFSVAVLSMTVLKSINRCPLKFDSGHYHGIEQLEKVVVHRMLTFKFPELPL